MGHLPKFRDRFLAFKFQHCYIYIALHAGGMTTDGKHLLWKNILPQNPYAIMHEFLTADQENLNPSHYQFISEAAALPHRITKTDSANKRTSQWGRWSQTLNTDTCWMVTTIFFFVKDSLYFIPSMKLLLQSWVTCGANSQWKRRQFFSGVNGRHLLIRNVLHQLCKGIVFIFRVRYRSQLHIFHESWILDSQYDVMLS